jgi:5-methyltetrahydropteroyltriglutamate--homocysteine methyltransferase
MMLERTTPPFRADHVGSLIRPAELIAARERAEKKEIADAELKRVQQAAIRDVVRLQEDLGLKLVTDGEYNRHSWHRDFMLKFKNVRMIPSRLTVRFHSAEGDRLHSPPTMQVTGKLARPDGGGIFVDDFKFLASIARATPKITLPSPTVMHFRGGREAIDEAAYPDIADFYDDLARLYRDEIRDLADAGCRYLQIDEVNLAYLCDAELRKQVANIGEDPATLPQTYARLLNDTIRDRPRDMTVCMHLCRGNFAGAWVAEGGRRLRADRRAHLQCGRRRRLFSRIRQRTRRRIRAAAIPAQGQGCRARARHHQERRARVEGRPQAPHRRRQQACSAGAARTQPAMRILQRHRRQHHGCRGRDR